MQNWNSARSWIEDHRDCWLDCVRIYLGLALLARGLLFMTNSQPGFIVDLLDKSTNSWVLTGALLHYVILAHLVGGTLLTVGLFTRLAALFQVPILAGAVFIVHRRDGLFAMGQNLELSALVLFLLCVFVVSGSGRFSFDHYVFEHLRPSAAKPKLPVTPTL